MISRLLRVTLAIFLTLGGFFPVSLFFLTRWIIFNTNDPLGLDWMINTVCDESIL